MASMGIQELGPREGEKLRRVAWTPRNEQEGALWGGGREVGGRERKEPQ